MRRGRSPSPVRSPRSPSPARISPVPPFLGERGERGERGREFSSSYTSPSRIINPISPPPTRVSPAYTSPTRRINPIRSPSPPPAPRKQVVPRHWIGRYGPLVTPLPVLLPIGLGAPPIGGGTPVGDISFLRMLPDERIEDIAANLDLQSLSNLCQSDQRMYRVCQNDYFWKRIFLKRYPSLTSRDLPSVRIPYLDGNKGRSMRSWREYLQLVSGMMHYAELPVTLYLVEEAKDGVASTLSNDLSKLSNYCIMSVDIPMGGKRDRQCVAMLNIPSPVLPEEGGRGVRGKGMVNPVANGTITFYYTSESTLTDPRERFTAYAGKYAWGIEGLGFKNSYYYVLMPLGETLPLSPLTPVFREGQ